MFRNNLHKGLTAMVFVVALALAGARPAAAEGLGWREVWDWMSSFWGGFSLTYVTEASSDETDPAPAPDGDCGPEIDPNGCPKPSGVNGSNG